jgi:hypothetical protein
VAGCVTTEYNAPNIFVLLYTVDCGRIIFEDELTISEYTTATVGIFITIFPSACNVNENLYSPCGIRADQSM